MLQRPRAPPAGSRSHGRGAGTGNGASENRPSRHGTDPARRVAGVPSMGTGFLLSDAGLELGLTFREQPFQLGALVHVEASIRNRKGTILLLDEITAGVSIYRGHV